MGKHKHSIRLLGFAMLALAFIAAVYYLLTIETPEITDPAIVSRGITSEWKLWLIGYLGIFFHFDLFGNTTWLMIPVLAYLTFTFIWRNKTERAFLFFFGASVLLVIIHGYFTYRYKYTLLYITVPLILYFYWKWMDRDHYRQWRPYMLLFLLTLGVLNSYYFGQLGKVYIYVMASLIPVGIYTGWVIFRSPKYKYYLKIVGVIIALGSLFVFVRPMRKGVANGLAKWKQRSWQNTQVPLELFHYLDSVNVNREMVLTNNSPNIYYYSDQPAVYYKGVIDWCYEFDQGVTTGRNMEQITSVIRDTFNCRYVFSSTYQNTYNDSLTYFLENHCATLLKDTSGYILYEVPPK